MGLKGFVPENLGKHPKNHGWKAHLPYDSMAIWGVSPPIFRQSLIQLSISYIPIVDGQFLHFSWSNPPKGCMSESACLMVTSQFLVGAKVSLTVVEVQELSKEGFDSVASIKSSSCHGWPWVRIETRGDDWGSPIFKKPPYRELVAR